MEATLGELRCRKGVGFVNYSRRWLTEDRKGMWEMGLNLRARESMVVRGRKEAVCKGFDAEAGGAVIREETSAMSLLSRPECIEISRIRC